MRFTELQIRCLADEATRVTRAPMEQDLFCRITDYFNDPNTTQHQSKVRHIPWLCYGIVFSERPSFRIAANGAEIRANYRTRHATCHFTI